MSEIYRLENIRRVYQGRTVLSVDDLAIHKWSIVGLAGENGGGKSTLMRVLAFIDPPDQGRIYFHGKLVQNSDLHERRNVALAPQDPYLLKRTVAANVGYGLKIRKIKGVRRKVEEALDMVGLSVKTFGKRYWRELSGGEAQRVALASRLILKPEVLLLDEPTASLDRESAELIHKAALMARDDWGATLVVVSHSLDWLKAVSDEILTLKHGRLVQG